MSAPRAPWDKPDYEEHQIHAIRALSQGRASEHQQKMAFETILAMAGTYDLPFVPGGAEGARASDFAAGKMWVGQQMVWCLKADIERYVKMRDLVIKGRDRKQSRRKTQDDRSADAPDSATRSRDPDRNP